METIKKLILVGLLIMLISACANLDPEDIPSDSEMIEPEELSPKLDYDLFLLRVDVDRHKIEKTERTTERTSRGNFQASNKTTTEKAPYSYMGINYGNGFFLDAHQNLCIDVIKLFKLDKLEYFKITKNTKGAFDSYYECIKDGSTYTIITKDPIKKEIKAVLEDGEIIFNDSKEKLILEEEAISYIPKTMLGKIAAEKIQKEGNIVKLAGRYAYEVQPTDSKYNAGHSNTIFIDGKILYCSKNNKKDHFLKMITTKDGYVFMESENKGFVIKKIDDEIIIKHEGKETRYIVELK